MKTPSKRGSRKEAEPTAPTYATHGDHMQALNSREAGKTVMYKQDAWGHIETRFVRTQNVKAWEAKGFVVR